MPHIHTEPEQHDVTVSAYIFCKRAGKWHALVHTHKKLGVLLQFGGHIELHEHPWTSLHHEIIEETGYDPTNLEVLQPPGMAPRRPNKDVQHPLPFNVNTHLLADPKQADHYHTDLGYVLVAKGDPEHSVAEGEATDLRWISRSELAALPDTEMTPDTKANFLQAFDSVLPSWKAYNFTNFDY